MRRPAGALLVSAELAAMASARGRGQAPPSPQAQAPIDLTGWWVSVVTEDWRWRMVTPPKGDYTSIPINNEGRRVGAEWDPARDEREGNACKAYGAAAIMRVPGRLHITWQDERTLKIETDAGPSEPTSVSVSTSITEFTETTEKDPRVFSVCSALDVNLTENLTHA